VLTKEPIKRLLEADPAKCPGLSRGTSPPKITKVLYANENIIGFGGDTQEVSSMQIHPELIQLSANKKLLNPYRLWVMIREYRSELVDDSSPVPTVTERRSRNTFFRRTIISTLRSAGVYGSDNTIRTALVAGEDVYWKITGDTVALYGPDRVAKGLGALSSRRVQVIPREQAQGSWARMAFWRSLAANSGRIVHGRYSRAALRSLTGVAPSTQRYREKVGAGYEGGVLAPKEFADWTACFSQEQFVLISKFGLSNEMSDYGFFTMRTEKSFQILRHIPKAFRMLGHFIKRRYVDGKANTKRGGIILPYAASASLLPRIKYMKVHRANAPKNSLLCIQRSNSHSLIVPKGNYTAWDYLKSVERLSMT